MRKAGKRRKRFPYYKVLLMDEVSLVWVDARKAAFDTMEEAKHFIAKELSNRPSRIMIVEGERSRRILKND